MSPAQSAHFGTYSPDNKTLLIPTKEQRLYKEDWIGLATLDRGHKLHLEHCPGEHMDLNGGDCAKRLIDRWIGWAR